MVIEKPYFLENPEWYYHDDENMIYRLTDKAPQDAVDSYNKFYAILEEYDTSAIEDLNG